MIHRPDGYFLDSNLLVLLAVGREEPALIPKHRRLARYLANDYDILNRLLSQVRRALVIPNTLSEASNLLGQHGEPERSRFMLRLRDIAQTSEEVFVPSAAASANSHFASLGLTDAALLQVANAETPLLTVDAALYRAALKIGHNVAVNFTFLRGI